MKEIAKLTKVLQLRNNIQFYLEEDEAKHIEMLLNSQDAPRFIQIKGRIVSVNEITGLFDPVDLVDQQKRKNGQWKDKQGNWHERGERICPTHTDNSVPYGKSCGLCL